MKATRDPDVACPAGQIVHPATSLNAADVHCRVIGHLQPAGPSPCCAAAKYVKCMIWVTELERTRFLRGERNARPLTRHTRVTKEIIGPAI